MIEDANASYRSIEVRPFSAAIGAEITGVDLSLPLDADTWAEIHRAFLQHQVIFFRDQDLTPAQHVAFSQRFGALEPYPFVHGIEGFPELIELVKLPKERHNFGGGWHVDMSFRTPPPLGAVLHAIEVPPAGGDTLFSSLYLAYETLSDGMKTLLGRLRGRHDSLDPRSHSQLYAGMQTREREGAPHENRAQPMVRVHPETGRRSLFVSPSYCWQLDGMTVAESRPLLDFLDAHAVRPEFQCRFHWTPDCVAVWDNRCVMHNVVLDDHAARRGKEGFRRVMRRATIRG